MDDEYGRGRPASAVPPASAAIAEPEDSRAGPAVASAWLGVIGLVVCLFLPWGAIASFVAIVVGLAARPRDSYGRHHRVVGLVTGILAIVLAAIWLTVVLGGIPTADSAAG